MFTLEETVVKYAWNESDGGDLPDTEDILALAPMPLLAEILKSRQKTLKAKTGNCARHDGAWKTKLDKLADMCLERSSSYSVKPLMDHLEDSLCTCKKSGKSKITDFNMPRETFEKEVWHLHNYFLNLFNTRLKSDDQLQELRGAIFETVDHCVIFMEVHRYFFLKAVKSLLQGMMHDESSWTCAIDCCNTEDRAAHDAYDVS